MEQTMPLDGPTLRRAWFHSRRGMLELDVLLLPYTEQALPGLDPEMQHQYLYLLESEDQDLFQWLTGKGEPEDPICKAMVTQVLAFNARRMNP